MMVIFQSCGGNNQGPEKIISDPTLSPTNHSQAELETSTELYLGEKHPLMGKDIFALYDVFFKTFVSPVVKNGFDISDSSIKFEGMHYLREIKDIGFYKLVSAIENISNQPSVLKNRSTSYKLSFYINSYNYHVIRIINKNYRYNGKLIHSIKDLSKGADSLDIFDNKFIRLEGEVISLNELLHKKILSLTKERDARILFAIHNASKSSPFIYNFSLKPENLEQSLEDLSRKNLLLPRFFKQDRTISKIHLSQIFHWYNTIFERDQNGGVLGFLKNYVTYGRLHAEQFLFMEFDWDLNKSDGPPSTILEIEDLTLLPNTREFSDLPAPVPSPVPDDDEITMRMKPCRRYQNNPMVDIVARCEEIIDQNTNNAPRSIVKGDICILEQNLLETTGKIRTIAGSLWDTKRRGNDSEVEQFDFFISEKSKTTEGSFSIISKDKFKSFIKFDAETSVLSIRQNIRYIAKKYRAANLQCIGFL